MFRSGLGAGWSLPVHRFQSFAALLGRQLWLPMCAPLLRIPREEPMERTKCSGVVGSLAIFTMTLALGVSCKAQEQSQEQSREAPPAPDQQRHKADGERHGLPIATYAGAPGTKFLVRLAEELGTKGTQANARFKVKTLEPLEAGSGIYLPAGAEIRGHLS